MSIAPAVSFDAASPAPLVLASAALERRLFTPPSERQPDQRRIYADATDRAWRKRHARRRRQASMLRL
jgi:hypothetical protein